MLAHNLRVARQSPGAAAVTTTGNMGKTVVRSRENEVAKTSHLFKERPVFTLRDMWQRNVRGLNPNSTRNM